jgi:hypothetical protein
MYVTENSTLVGRNQFPVSCCWLRKPWKTLKSKRKGAFDIVHSISHIRGHDSILSQRFVECVQIYRRETKPSGYKGRGKSNCNECNAAQTR